MADDTIEFLEMVIGGPADLVGWSDGGIIALMVAARRPDLVAKLVPISANIELAGVPEPIQQFFATTPADAPPFQHLATLHAELSPHGAEHWPALHEKFVRMVFDAVVILETTELARITAPTLVMAGDDDMVTFEHTSKIYESIPSGQLAIVPGTSHFLAVEKPELVNGLIRDFLLNDPVPTMMPIRRAGGEEHS